MSLYVTFYGSVTLSPEADAAFRASPSWETWGPFPDEERADGAHTLSFFGCFRNLYRYLPIDLCRAMEHGAVEGILTTDCDDGCNSRTVLVYENDRVLIGDGECFNRPVELYPVRFLGLSPRVGDGSHLDFLIPDTEQQPVRLCHGAPAQDRCGCGGYDEEFDYPVCTSELLASPEPSVAHPTE